MNTFGFERNLDINYMDASALSWKENMNLKNVGAVSQHMYIYND